MRGVCPSSLDPKILSRVRQLYLDEGREAALGELRRRVLALNERTAPYVLDVIMGFTRSVDPDSSHRS